MTSLYIRLEDSLDPHHPKMKSNQRHDTVFGPFPKQGDHFNRASPTALLPVLLSRSTPSEFRVTSWRCALSSVGHFLGALGSERMVTAQMQPPTSVGSRRVKAAMMGLFVSETDEIIAMGCWGLVVCGQSSCVS